MADADFVGTWRSLVARLLWEQDVAGSNPVVPTIFQQYAWQLRYTTYSRVAIAVKTRVWFNGRTSAFQADNAGSIPVTRSIQHFKLRQLAEFLFAVTYLKITCFDRRNPQMAWQPIVSSLAND